MTPLGLVHCFILVLFVWLKAINILASAPTNVNDNGH
jgi:hypothetical protein